MNDEVFEINEKLNSQIENNKGQHHDTHHDVRVTFRLHLLLLPKRPGA